jgi:hypothetical protein
MRCATEIGSIPSRNSKVWLVLLLKNVGEGSGSLLDLDDWEDIMPHSLLKKVVSYVFCPEMLRVVRGSFYSGF